MLGFSDIDVKQTRFYQDVYAEGEQEGKLVLILRLLNRRFGELDTNLIEQIRDLDVSQLEELAEALLGFSSQRLPLVRMIWKFGYNSPIFSQHDMAPLFLCKQ